MEAKKFTNRYAASLLPKDSNYKVMTGLGFYLFITKTGSKLWRFDYSYGGKRNTFSLGNFKDVDLEQAQINYSKAKELLRQGINPAEERNRKKEEIRKKVNEEKQTFKAVALEWHKKASMNKAPGYAEELMQRLENHIFNFIGEKPIKDLKTSDILLPLRAKEDLGKYEMAHRLASVIKNVFRYAKVAGYIEFNIASDISDALIPAPRKKHRACITDPVKVGKLLNDIENYNGSIPVKYALKILPYIFVRSKELRGAKWEEFDLEKVQWLIPAERMKRQRPHLVPLSKQVIELLDKLKELSPNSEYLFPSDSTNGFISCEGLRKSLEVL